jgi:hypothetical protein
VNVSAVLEGITRADVIVGAKGVRSRSRLVFANVLWPQAVRWTVEASGKIFNGADLRTCGIFCVNTTLEFFQHHFSEMDHRDLLVTHNLSRPSGSHRSPPHA